MSKSRSEARERGLVGRSDRVGWLVGWWAKEEEEEDAGGGGGGQGRQAGRHCQAGRLVGFATVNTPTSGRPPQLACLQVCVCVCVLSLPSLLLLHCAGSGRMQMEGGGR